MSEPTNHPSDDDLVLLFYGELAEGEQAELTAHLSRCAACRTDWHSLTRTLHLAGTLPVADPGADFETRVWAAVVPQLPVRHSPTKRLQTFTAWAAALVLVAWGAWWMTARTPAPSPSAITTVNMEPDEGFEERVLLTAVDAHLLRAEMLFVEVLNVPADEGASLTDVRDTAGDMVASGRLYRQTARDAGYSALAGMLDDLETVLLEVARGAGQPDESEVRALQGRIEQDDLLFKVRAVASDIQDRQSRTTSGGGTL